MKTSIDIPDALLKKARDAADARGTTIRMVVAEALVRYLADDPAAEPAYAYEDRSVGGQGLEPGYTWDDVSRGRGWAYEEEA